MGLVNEISAFLSKTRMFIRVLDSALSYSSTISHRHHQKLGIRTFTCVLLMQAGEGIRQFLIASSVGFGP